MRTQTLDVQIPAGKEEGGRGCLAHKLISSFLYSGISDGQTLRVPVGQTEAYVLIRVSKSNKFTRDGFSVHSDLSITYSQAVLGGVAKAAGLNGTLDVKVRDNGCGYGWGHLTDGVRIL